MPPPPPHLTWRSTQGKECGNKLREGEREKWKRKGGWKAGGGRTSKRMKGSKDKRQYGKFLTADHLTAQKPMFSPDVFQKMDFKIMCELNNNLTKRASFQRANTMKHAGRRKCPRCRQGPGQEVEGRLCTLHLVLRVCPYKQTYLPHYRMGSTR